jgi:hypothetical protein
MISPDIPSLNHPNYENENYKFPFAHWYVDTNPVQLNGPTIAVAR